MSYIGLLPDHECVNSSEEDPMGCHKSTNAGEERWAVLCWHCAGIDSEECPICEGQRLVRMNRCPSFHRRLASDLNHVFRAYRMLKEYSVFPMPGGTQNQTTSFLATVEYIDFYISKSRKEFESVKERFQNAIPKPA